MVRTSTPLLFISAVSCLFTTVLADGTPAELLRSARISKDSTQKVQRRSTEFSSTNLNPFVARALGGLIGRQTAGACQSGDYSCGDGTCCEIGRQCFPLSCCLPGEIECSEANCYDPDTEVCCSDGGTCDAGQDCVADNSCCSSGRIPCSEEYCYNPDSEVCCDDGSVCLDGAQCGDDSCLVAGGGSGGLTSSRSSSRSTFTLSPTTSSRTARTTATEETDDETSTTTSTRRTTQAPTTARTSSTTSSEGGAVRHGAAPIFIGIGDFAIFCLTALRLL